MPDAITVNPMLGFDTLDPFLNAAKQTGKGLFVLVRTSNPGSTELQDVHLADGRTWSEMLADRLAMIAGRSSTGGRGRIQLGRCGRRGDADGDDGEHAEAVAEVDFFVAGVWGAGGDGGDDAGGVYRWGRRDRVGESEYFVCASGCETCGEEDELGAVCGGGGE